MKVSIKILKLYLEIPFCFIFKKLQVFVLRLQIYADPFQRLEKIWKKLTCCYMAEKVVFFMIGCLRITSVKDVQNSILLL